MTSRKLGWAGSQRSRAAREGWRILPDDDSMPTAFATPGIYATFSGKELSRRLFETHTEARAFVEKRAAEGSVLHQRRACLRRQETHHWLT